MPRNGTSPRVSRVSPNHLCACNSLILCLDSPMASGPFWLALICQLIIVFGYFWFYRKEQLCEYPRSTRQTYADCGRQLDHDHRIRPTIDLHTRLCILTLPYSLACCISDFGRYGLLYLFLIVSHTRFIFRLEKAGVPFTYVGRIAGRCLESYRIHNTIRSVFTGWWMVTYYNEPESII